MDELGTVSVPVDAAAAEDAQFSWRKLWAFSGPGLLMSIAYLDPGNIEADLQSGAHGGYSLLWVLLWSTALGCFLQILAARLGVVTGQHMAQIAREHLPRPASVTLWIMAELAIITSDVQEVVGSAIALNILFGLRLWLGVLVTALDTFTFLLLQQFGVRRLEFLFAVLIAVMAGSFAVCFFISRPDAGAMLYGLLVPTVTSETAVQAVGQLGAVIMPHNLYLHSALVLSRAVDRSDCTEVASANFYNAIESALSLALSFVISSLVICVFASGFFGQAGATDAGLSTAGDLLHDRFGGSIRYMWALGLLASGQSSTMTGTLAGQYVMQGFVDIDLVPWKRVLFTRSIAIVPAVLVATLYTSGLDQLNELLNVAQSIQLPFALLPLILFSSDATIMGEEYAVGERVRAFLWAIFAALLAINVYLAQKLAIELIGTSALAIVCYLLIGALYFGFLASIVYHRLEHAAVARNIVPYEFLNDLSASRCGGSSSGVANADDHDVGPDVSDVSEEMMRVHQFYLARASNALFSISDEESDYDVSWRADGDASGAGSGGAQQSERRTQGIVSDCDLELEDKDGL